MSIPIFLPKQSTAENNITVLAGDVGGTKTNLGIFVSDNKKMILKIEKTYKSSDFNSVDEIILKFLSDINQKVPSVICLGVAGPVINNEVEITNLCWKLNADELKQKTGAAKILLLNDLHANAYGLAGLEENDFVTISAGKNLSEGNMAIIAPGTGLGEAGLFWDGHSYHPFPTEGGHCDFAPQSEDDILLYRFMKKKFPFVSWELVASGSAIHNLYFFLRDEKKMEEPKWLTEKLKDANGNISSLISEFALENDCAICIETMNMFTRFVSRAACNLVLKMKATGGLFLGGGIPPKNLKFFQSDLFYKSFIQCDRMGELIESVPVKIIMNQYLPLIGAAYYGAFSE